MGSMCCPEDTPMAPMLEHMTDVAIRVEGRTPARLFAHALEEMNQILSPETCRNPRHADCFMEFEIRAPDPTALLVDFLSECLALTYIQRALFCYVHFFEIEQIDPTTLRARIYGRWYKTLENEIKAVTFHGADVRQNGEGNWETTLLFDL